MVDHRSRSDRTYEDVLEFVFTASHFVLAVTMLASSFMWLTDILTEWQLPVRFLGVIVAPVLIGGLFLRIYRTDERFTTPLTLVTAGCYLLSPVVVAFIASLSDLDTGFTIAQLLVVGGLIVELIVVLRVKYS